MLKMNKRKYYVLLLFLATSCSIDNIGVKTIVDIAGDSVMIPEEPSRVVARTANSTSFMVGMGMQDKIVGTMDSISPNTWSEKFMENIADIPSFDWSPSAESLYEVNSDLVLLADPTICRELRSKGITAVTYKQYSNKEMLDSVKLLGDVFGEKAKEYGDKWLSYYYETVEGINDFLENVPIDDRPVVYYIYGQSNKGLYRSSGYNTIISEMIEICGGIYGLREFDSTVTKFTAEEVLKTNPDVVFVGGVYQHSLIEQLYDAEEWSNIPAITGDCVYNIPLGFIPWDLYGVEYPLLLKYFCHKMYSNYDFDVFGETKEFMKEFYNIEFSDKEIQYMLGGLDPNGERFH